MDIKHLYDSSLQRTLAQSSVKSRTLLRYKMTVSVIVHQSSWLSLLV
jgi:hypothetical protein